MTLALCASLASVLSLLWSIHPAARAAPVEPATHTVIMEGTRFEPADLKIKVGDTVVWVNKDPFPHTATSKDGEFDSKEIDAGKTWKFAFKKKGQFGYVCTLHLPMKGTLTVE